MTGIASIDGDGSGRPRSDNASSAANNYFPNGNPTSSTA